MLGAALAGAGVDGTCDGEASPSYGFAGAAGAAGAAAAGAGAAVDASRADGAERGALGGGIDERPLVPVKAGGGKLPPVGNEGGAAVSYPGAGAEPAGAISASNGGAAGGA